MNNKINTALIYNYMWENRLTKVEFSKKCGIAPSTLRKILLGSEKINILSLCKIAICINKRLCDMFKD